MTRAIRAPAPASATAATEPQDIIDKLIQHVLPHMVICVSKL